MEAPIWSFDTGSPGLLGLTFISLICREFCGLSTCITVSTVIACGCHSLDGDPGHHIAQGSFPEVPTAPWPWGGKSPWDHVPPFLAELLVFEEKSNSSGEIRMKGTFLYFKKRILISDKLYCHFETSQNVKKSNLLLIDFKQKLYLCCAKTSSGL